MKTLQLNQLSQLRRLHLNITKSQSLAEGARRSNTKGRSAEFSGYRSYNPGDDMRYVDWNAYARLDKLYIKEYMEEKEGRVYIYLDTSRSMEYGEKLKSTLMSELTQSMAYIATSSRDSVYVVDLHEPTRYTRVGPGSEGVLQLKKLLEDIETSGRIDIAETLKKALYSGPQVRGGLSIVISDFMDESFLSNVEGLLRYASSMDRHTLLIQVLSREETFIDEMGAFQFIDIEDTSRDVRVSLDRYTLEEYYSALDDYKRSLKNAVEKTGDSYISCHTGENINEIIFDKMRSIYL